MRLRHHCHWCLPGLVADLEAVQQRPFGRLGLLVQHGTEPGDQPGGAEPRDNGALQVGEGKGRIAPAGVAGDFLQEAQLVGRGGEKLRPEAVLSIVRDHPEVLHQHAVEALGEALLREALGDEGQQLVAKVCLGLGGVEAGGDELLRLQQRPLKGGQRRLAGMRGSGHGDAPLVR